MPNCYNNVNFKGNVQDDKRQGENMLERAGEYFCTKKPVSISAIHR